MISCLQLARISAALSGSTLVLGAAMRVAMSLCTYLRHQSHSESLLHRLAPAQRYRAFERAPAL